MSSTYYPKPRLVERWTVKPKGPNTVCQKTLYENEQRFLCSAPTVNGKQYCETCATKTLKGRDRTVPAPTVLDAYHWSNDQLIPRKRA
jgi:hypothetical protein